MVYEACQDTHTQDFLYVSPHTVTVLSKSQSTIIFHSASTTSICMMHTVYATADNWCASNYVTIPDTAKMLSHFIKQWDTAVFWKHYSNKESICWRFSTTDLVLWWALMEAGQCMWYWPNITYSAHVHGNKATWYPLQLCGPLILNKISEISLINN